MHWLEFYKNKKVLITGHTGFKGTWMTHFLLQAGAEVLGYSLPPATAPNFFDLCKFSDKLHSVNGDIRNLSFMESVFNDFPLSLSFTWPLSLLFGNPTAFPHTPMKST